MIGGRMEEEVVVVVGGGGGGSVVGTINVSFRGLVLLLLCLLFPLIAGYC